MLQVLSCFSVILDYVNYKCCFCQGHFIRSCFPLEIHLFAVVLYCMCYNISTSVSQTIKMLPHAKVQTALQKLKKIGKELFTMWLWHHYIHTFM